MLLGDRRVPVLWEAKRPDHYAALVVYHELTEHAAELQQATHTEVHRLLKQVPPATLELLLEPVYVDEDGCHEADLREVLDGVALDGVPRALLGEASQGGAKSLHGGFHAPVVLGLTRRNVTYTCVFLLGL